jgi:hypothetical protein
MVFSLQMEAVCYFEMLVPARQRHKLEDPSSTCIDKFMLSMDNIL